MADHTPTPWRVQASYPTLVEGQMADGMWALVADAGGDVDMPEEQWANNAAFIVRAVNAHDDLVKALEGMLAPYDGWDDFQLQRRTDAPTFRAVKQAKLVLHIAKAAS